MPIGGGKFTLEKTWHSAAPSTTTLNASGNFTVPYGKYDIQIYGYGGAPIPGNVSGYNDYYYSASNPGYYNNSVIYYQTNTYYQPVNLYTGAPTPGYGGSVTYGPSYSPGACPSPNSYIAYGPYGSASTYYNYSCSPGPTTYVPGNTYYVLVPGNPNYNPSNIANPATLMGTTIPGGATNYSANAVKVNYQNFPSGPAGTSYPAVLSSGAQMVIVYR
jgi:hypothetical protein